MLSLLTNAIRTIALHLTTLDADNHRTASLLADMTALTDLAGAIKFDSVRLDHYKAARNACHRAAMFMDHTDCDDVYTACKAINDAGADLASATIDYNAMTYAQLIDLDPMDQGSNFAAFLDARSRAKAEAVAQLRTAADAYEARDLDYTDVLDLARELKLSASTRGQVMAGARRRADKARDAAHDAMWNAFTPDELTAHIRDLARKVS